MITDFERIRLDIFGQGVTITSWYESDKQRFRANAPAYLHVMNESDAADAHNIGATRERAIKAVRERLENSLRALDAKRRR